MPLLYRRGRPACNAHFTSTGSNFPSINAERGYVGKFCLPFTRQHQLSLHTTYARDHYPSYTRIQTDGLSESKTYAGVAVFVAGLAVTASFGKELINHLSKEHLMILVF